jgi:hypothetical protein
MRFTVSMSCLRELSVAARNYLLPLIPLEYALERNGCIVNEVRSMPPNTALERSRGR